LAGIQYSNAIGNETTLLQEEMTVRAEPYYFSLGDIFNDRIEYTWSINNREVDASDFQKQNEMTFRSNSNSGISRVSLEMQNMNFVRALQSAERTLNVNLGE
jgi:hypothetical protein